jgi:hypothetical protein
MRPSPERMFSTSTAMTIERSSIGGKRGGQIDPRSRATSGLWRRGLDCGRSRRSSCCDVLNRDDSPFLSRKRDGEVVAPQIGDGRAVLVENRCVDQHEVNARSECDLRRLLLTRDE